MFKPDPQHALWKADVAKLIRRADMETHGSTPVMPEEWWSAVLEQGPPQDPTDWEGLRSE